jgi:flagellin
MAASYSALNMSRANNLLTKSLQRLSSGKRIVSPADDAGGLAVGMKLQSSLKRAAASRMNTQNGTSFLQMQDSVMKVAGEILDRMAELKSFHNDISKNAADRETYNHEFHELQTELNSLQSQKFNGVSLFATVEPDNNPLKIITSDDGLGEHIELSRTGLFENLKSKFGADGVLNSGSNGEYRQLVGDFTTDGGLTDADPGKASRAYKSGEVVYKNGASAGTSGYFMALTDVASGTRIEDTANSSSKWIRIAETSGLGFAESHPSAELYNHANIKYNSDGEQFSYLKGDMVKVQAHWSSPGSYFYMEAQSDVPRNISLEQLFTSGNGYVGANGFFNYVGEDSSADNYGINKPTTDFVRTNGNFSAPTTYTAANTAVALANTATLKNYVAATPGAATYPTMATQISSELYDLMVANSADGYTPDVVIDSSNGTDIYQAATNWGISVFDPNITNKEGDVVLYTDLGADDLAGTADDTFHILEFTDMVKGNWSAKGFNTDEYVFHDGVWHKADAASAPTADDIPYNPDYVNLFNVNTAYSAGDAIRNDDTDKFVKVANANMRGAWVGSKSYFEDSTQPATQQLPVVQRNGLFYEFVEDHHGTWSSGLTIAANETVEYNGRIYQAVAANTTSDPVTAGTASWADLGSSTAAATLASMSTGGAAVDVATQAATNSTGAYFSLSKWQHNSTGAEAQNPVLNSAAFTDRGAEFEDLSNTSIWTKTHYGELQNRTVGTSYTYGDNIYYQGKHYIYTSHLDSNDPIYVSPSDDSYTEFDDLLRLGAIRELPMYVDTIGGGGGANLPEGIYYRPNQDLNFVDRLPNSGTVRTNSVERRTDAPLPPGDEIYNSADDQFYGGINAGNDGIFGTLDDFYSTTADPNIAMNGGHVDADADNNKDLLDKSNGLENFSVADFVDYIQTLSNVRAVNGGTQSRLVYANRMLEENEINLGAATSRIMDADMAYESTKMAQQNVLLQAGASMVTQANQLSNIVLSLLQ